MYIKEPDSDASLKALFELLENLVYRIYRCYQHDTITILYFSTFIVSPNVMYHGSRLTDLVKIINDLKPSDTVCALRTVSHAYFKGDARRRHDEALKAFEKVGCYIRQFNPIDEEFVNHAKFLVVVHYCYDENIRCYGHYYGSTNLTTSGLANIGHLYLGWGRYRPIMGNYEVYRYSSLYCTDFFQRRWRSLQIASDVKKILEDNLNKFEEENLKKRCREHTRLIDELRNHLLQKVAYTSLEDLITAYFMSIVLIYDMLAFIESLPGRELTREFMKYTWKEVDALNLETILELEQILPSLEFVSKYPEEVMKQMGYDKRTLRERVLERLRYLEHLLSFVEKYIGEIRERRLSKFLDDHEYLFFKRLQEYGKRHLNRLERLMSKLRGSIFI